VPFNLEFLDPHAGEVALLVAVFAMDNGGIAVKLRPGADPNAVSSPPPPPPKSQSCLVLPTKSPIRSRSLPRSLRRTGW
jgi:hypothetical protein